MPVLDSSALNDNEESFAFLRAVLAQSEPRKTRRQHWDGSLRQAASDAEPLCRHSASGVPLIVGVPVSITIASK